MRDSQVLAHLPFSSKCPLLTETRPESLFHLLSSVLAAKNRWQESIKNSTRTMLGMKLSRKKLGLQSLQVRGFYTLFGVNSNKNSLVLEIAIRWHVEIDWKPTLAQEPTLHYRDSMVTILG